MKLYTLVAAGVLVLAGCGSSESEAPAPSPKSALEAPPDVPVMGKERRILAIGDSLFTGHGLEEGESYPAMLEAALRARGINARIANAGVSGDTTGGGRDRLDFTLNAQDDAPELVVISLGGNDMLRSLPPERARENLDAMLAELKRREIDVLLLGMLAAPNLGKDYADEFNAIYPALAKKHGASLVPFFLQPLMDRPDLVQDDNVHPTRTGIEAMVAATVDDVAKALGDSKGAE